jgi:2'-5' RNA ligase
MRLFIAIELPLEARAHLARVCEKLGPRISSGGSRTPRVSFTRTENLHLTLKFLGEVDENLSAALAASLTQVRAGGKIGIFAEKVECLPDRGPVRIVAARFGGTLPTLEALHQAIEGRCQGLGFAPETRTYRPHVTLARARPTLPARVRGESGTAVSGDLPGPEVDVREFVLVRSHLGQQGSRYEVIARFGLTDQT